MSKARDIADLDFNAPDIDGGNIDGAVIGGTTPAAGTFSQVNVDNITIDGNEIDVSSGSMTLDSASQIILDAAGGNFQFLKSGTEFARIFESGSDFYIYNPISDKDIKFYGNDGGTSFTALTLDMSEAGEATFNSDIKLGDGKVARFGTDQDFRIGFDGNNAVLQNVTSDSDITFLGKDGSSTITALTLDMSAAGAATFNDSVTAGSDIEIRSGNKLILQRPDNGVASNISTDSTGAMILDSLNGEGFFFNNNGTNAFKIDPINATFAGTLDVAGEVEFATSQGAGYAGSKVAGLEVGTTASGGSLLVRTPSLNGSFSSGLFVDGAYSSELSQVNLTAAGVHSGGGYQGHLHLRTTSATSIWPAITAKPDSLQFYTSNTERMSISATGEISRTTANNALDDSITTLRYVYPNSNVARASCQCDVFYSTEHLGHNTTLWLSVLTPQAAANWDAGGSATMKLTWSGFHAAGTSMAKWDCVFGNNHAGTPSQFRWARSAVSMLEAPDSYYGYTPGVEFYRQTGDGNGFTGGATTMRVLWIKITGNASSNVCPTRSLEISGVVGGPTMKYVVAHGGYSTPTNVSAIGAYI
jgi:hypothetical protein